MTSLRREVTALMHCPQCGQQQVSGVIRFCSRCGFPLEGTIQVLANGGQLPVYAAGPESTEISPRKKGVKQGGMLFLLGVVAVPALGVLYNWTDINLFGFLTALAAVLLFIGGPLRMLFAALFEEGARRPVLSSQYMQPPQPQLSTPMRQNVLPSPSVPSAPSWRQPTTTGELVRPPSVTENTTRLLNKDTDRQD
jgi:hypothetical protein